MWKPCWIVVLTICMSAQAQQAAWNVHQESGKLVAIPATMTDGSVVVTVWPEEELKGVQLQAWLEARVSADVQSRGTLQTQGKSSQTSGNTFSTLNIYSDNRGRYVMLYTAVQKSNGKAQLATVRTPADNTAQANLHDAGAEVAHLIQQSGAVASAQTDSTAKAQPKPLQPVQLTHGVRMDEIAAILHEGHGASTPMGFRYVESVGLLLKDGTMYDALTAPPDELNAMDSRIKEPAHWHRWRREGDLFYRQEERSGQWTKIEADVVQPLEQGSVLNRALILRGYNSFGTGGGSTLSARFHLYPDGRYDRGMTVRQSGGSLGTGTASATTTMDQNGRRSSMSGIGTGGTAVTRAGSQSRDNAGAMSGTYRVAGYTLELQRADGQMQRLLAFYPFPNAHPPNRSIYIGGASYSDDR